MKNENINHTLAVDIIKVNLSLSLHNLLLLPSQRL